MAVRKAKYGSPASNKNLTIIKQPVQKVNKILFQKKLCMADRHDQQLEREAVQGMRAKLDLQFHRGM
jgi:hypothetical protein